MYMEFTLKSFIKLLSKIARHIKRNMLLTIFNMINVGGVAQW